MLEARAISVVRDGRGLLDAVSIAIAPGEIVAVLGENGAGKSTLLGALCGDLSVSAGAVTLNDRPIGAWSALERARMRAVLPQEQHIAFGFSALEITLLGRYPHCAGAPGRVDVEIALAALAEVEAVHLRDRSVTTLSGGERARVQLARVLAQLMDGAQDAARFLLLDEPTANLDLAHQHLVMERVRGFASDRRVGVVAVLHDFNLALQYADRVLCLKQGRVLGVGAPAAVLTEALFAEGFGMRCALLEHAYASVPVVVALGRCEDRA